MSKRTHINLKTGKVTVEVEPGPPVKHTVQDVKDEARRRIIAIVPEWKQRNLTAQAALLVKKGTQNWTAEDQAAWDAGEAIWDQVKAIRNASDVLEGLKPIPDPSTWDGWP